MLRGGGERLSIRGAAVLPRELPIRFHRQFRGDGLRIQPVWFQDGDVHIRPRRRARALPVICMRIPVHCPMFLVSAARPQRSLSARLQAARAVAALRDGRCWCRGGSKLGVFPLAVDGFPAVVENEPGGYRPARLSASRFQALSSACHASPVSGSGGSGAEVPVSASRSRAGWTRSSTEMFRAAAFAASRRKVSSGTVRWGMVSSIEGDSGHATTCRRDCPFGLPEENRPINQLPAASRQMVREEAFASAPKVSRDVAKAAQNRKVPPVTLVCCGSPAFRLI